jgi:protein-S-isoprenylcysteine O-methyltransferase Ste14
MRVEWPQMLRLAYRKQPVISFAVTMGLVNAVIGTLSDRSVLATLGISTVGIALALRWWQLQKAPVARPRPTERSNRAPMRYLPPARSGAQLPGLQASRQKARIRNV